MTQTRFVASVKPPKSRQEPAYWFIFQGFKLLVIDSEGTTRVPQWINPQSNQNHIPLKNSHFLGELISPNGTFACYCAEVDGEFDAPEGMSFSGLRPLFNRLPDEMLALAGRAVQIVEWDRTHQFCGRCGASVHQIEHERAKKCSACGLTTYPRISPAIIVSVERPSPTGPELLLARNHRYPPGFFSVLAGFVEPGESLEMCVRREVREEVGLELKNIRYFGSQSWPFPHSLMIAFTAEYAAGAVVLEEEELDEAGWYKAEKLPLIPPRVSIARQLIDAFVARSG